MTKTATMVKTSTAAKNKRLHSTILPASGACQDSPPEDSVSVASDGAGSISPTAVEHQTRSPPRQTGDVDSTSSNNGRSATIANILADPLPDEESHSIKAHAEPALQELPSPAVSTSGGEHEQTGTVEHARDREQEQRTTSVSALETGTSIEPAEYQRFQELHPRLDDRWSIVARIISKEKERHWTNKHGGGGDLLNFHIIDSSGDLMRATLFNSAVAKFRSTVQVGSTCRFAGGRIKHANPVFTDRKFTVALDDRASVVPYVSTAAPCEDALSVSTVRGLSTSSNKAKVSVVGIICDVGPTKRVTSKTGKALVKREFLLVDDSLAKIVCTAWGYQAQDELAENEGVAALICGGQIDDYNGERSMNVGVGTEVIISPDVSVARSLRTWHQSFGKAAVYDLVRPNA